VNIYSIKDGCQPNHANSIAYADACAARTVAQLATPIEVIGLGITGLSVVRYLLSIGIRPGVMDTRTDPAGLATLNELMPNHELHVGGLDAGRLKQAATIIVSPGLSLETPELRAAVARGADVIGDIELFARVCHAPVVAITGSNGKSTVTSMLRDMCSAADVVAYAGGNLGPPALDLLALPIPEFYLLELSSFQLEATHSLKTAASAFLNLSEDHLDRYADMNTYAAAKARIFDGAERCVVGPGVVVDVSGPLQRVERIEPSAGNFGIRIVDGRRWLADGHMTLMAIDELPVPGEHNELNALAALALGRAIGLPWKPMFAALRAFRGLRHRCELIGEAHGVRWINDSKGTNVGAAVAAVKGLASAGPIVLLAGGLGKGADFQPLADAARGRTRLVVLFGHDAPLISAALSPETKQTQVVDLQAAVRAAAAAAQPGDTALLSPACASFDMFDSFEHRGECFTVFVHQVLQS
jgi:UDP-N-acetylmuramoylalanine--D-glutamate ligase